MQYINMFIQIKFKKKSQLSHIILPLCCSVKEKELFICTTKSSDFPKEYVQSIYVVSLSKKKKCHLQIFYSTLFHYHLYKVVISLKNMLNLFTQSPNQREQKCHLQIFYSTIFHFHLHIYLRGLISLKIMLDLFTQKDYTVNHKNYKFAP